MSAPGSVGGETSVDELRPNRSLLAWARANLSLRDSGIVVAFVLLVGFLTVSSDVFLTSRNILNVLEQSAAIGIIAAAGTLVIIAGGFDLSVGGVFALSGIVAAMTVGSQGPVVAVAAALLTGAVVGGVNGLLTTRVGINPFIATLGMLIILRGVSLASTGGFLVPIADEGFIAMGRGGLGPVKYSVLVLAVVILVLGFVLARTVFGRYVYASGGNAEAAQLAGVPVALVRTMTFVISGMAAALAGVLLAARAANGQADTGNGLEFQVIAAIVVGGTSIFGGEGAMWRTVVGVLLIALVGNGFNLLAVAPTYQQVVQGTIILLAVGVDGWARTRTA